MRFITGQIPWNKGTKGIMKINSGSFIKGQIAPNKKEYLNKICPTCQKEFKVKPSLARVQHCSQSCVMKGKPSRNKGRITSLETRQKQRFAKLGIRGEKHWNWRPWTKQSNRDRGYFRDTVQKRVFERDNYKCTICGLNKNLQVDHIKRWSKFPDLRFVLENCRTLCSKCHYKITFGRDMPTTVKSWGHNFSKRVPIFQIM